MRWLKRRLRRWLGLGEVEQRLARLELLTKDLFAMGVDVHFKEPSMILIYSRLNGRMIKEIRADFRDVRELQALVDELRHRFNTDRVTFDMPSHMKAFFGR